MQLNESNSLRIKEWCRSQAEVMNKKVDPKILADDLNISLDECHKSLEYIVQSGYAEKYLDIECPNLECGYVNSIEDSLINERYECKNEDCKMVFIPKNYIEDRLQGIYYNIDEEYYKLQEKSGFSPYNYMNIKNDEGKVINLKKSYEREDNNIMSEKQKRIFISHCSANKEISDLVFQLIKDMKINHNDIYYSSSEETGAALFSDCLKSIEEEFNNYELIVIFIVSREFNNSPVCLAETGATWVTCKDRYIPIILPPFSYDDLGGVIGSNKNSILLSDTRLDEKLETLKNTLEEVFGIQKEQQIQHSEWNTKKKKFIEDIKKYIKEIRTIDTKIEDLNILDGEAIFNVLISNNTKQRRKIGEVNITIVGKNGEQIGTQPIAEEDLKYITLTPLKSMNVYLKIKIKEDIKIWNVDKEKCIIDVVDYVQE